MLPQSSFCLERPREASPQKHGWDRLLEVIEVGPASLCSFILWQYARELDAPSNPEYIDDSQVAGPVLSNAFHHPAPRLVLVSALGFGCCVSSFGYRRQKEDPFQAVVFALLVGTVAAVAYGVGASSSLILLGCMPFATCAAMVLSLWVHALFKWSRIQDGSILESQEKLQLL